MNDASKEIKLFGAVRHGRANNVQEDSSLSPYGIDQVTQLAPVLLDFILKDGGRGLVVAASHIRTRETGQIISNLSGGRVDFAVSTALDSDNIRVPDAELMLDAISGLVQDHSSVMAVVSGVVIERLMMEVQPNGKAHWMTAGIGNGTALVAEGDEQTFYIQPSGITEIGADY